MKRICCFCESWESGGIESFLHNVILRMNCDELEIDIAAACVRESVFTDALRAKGVRFFELSGNQRNYPRNFRLFRKLLQTRKYDVVHLNLFQGLSLRYVRIAQDEHVPMRIVHSHGAGLRNSKTKPLKLLLHQFGSLLWAGAATDHWACSFAAAEFLFPDKVMREQCVSVIPNGIDTERFRFHQESRDTIRTKLGLRSQILVGTVGRLSREKNQEFALEVFSKFHKVHPDSHFVLVGDGEEREALQQRAQQLGVEDAVIFWGPATNVEQLLCAMDLFLFPSHVEGLGIAVVEAQASGLPVLCSDRIPAEARLTSRLDTMPLEAGADAWSEKMAQLLWRKEARSSGADEVKAAGFDVQDVAQQIAGKYMGS